MAEEVEIVGVEGTLGPASEATLQKLLKTAQERNKADNIEEKLKKAAAAATENATQVTDEFAKEMEEATTVVDVFGSAMGGVSGAILGLSKAMVGFTFGTFANMVDAFADGNGTLTDFVSQIPIVGSILGRVTGYLESTFMVFQDLSRVGATFNNDLNNIRDAAVNSRMSLDQFAGFVSQNAKNLQALSGTVTQGAVAIASLNQALGPDMRENLLAMGLTFEEINEELVNYAMLNRGRERLSSANQAAVAERAGEYAKTLRTLSKLTGDDVTAIRERQQAMQSDIAFQAMKAKLGENELANLESAMAQAELAGPAAVARLKEMIMGFPAMTRETQLFAAGMQNSEKALAKMAQTIFSGAGDVDAKMAQSGAEMLAGMLDTFDSAGNVITQGILTGEGIGSEFARMLESSGMSLTKYANMDRETRIATIMTDIAAAKAEQEMRNDAIDGFAEFNNAIKDLYRVIIGSIVSPIMRTAGPAIKAFSTAVSDGISTLVGDGSSGPIANFKKRLDEMTNDLKEMSITEALRKWFEIPADEESLMSGVFNSIRSKIKKWLDIDESESILGTVGNRILESITAGLAKVSWGNVVNSMITGIKEAFSGKTTLTEEQQGTVNNLNERIQFRQAKSTNTIGDWWSNRKEIAELTEERDTLINDNTSQGMWSNFLPDVSVIKGVALAIGGTVGLAAAVAGLGVAVSVFGTPAAAIGVAVLSGAALAASGAFFIASKGLGEIASSMGMLVDNFERFEKMDANVLTNIVTAISPLADNLWDFAAGGVLANLVGDNTLVNISKGIDSFTTIDHQALLNLGPALESLATGMSAVAGGGIFESFGKMISGLTGTSGLNSLAESLTDFKTVDTSKLVIVTDQLEKLSSFNNNGIDLDSGSIDNYKKSIEGLTDALDKLNKELNESNTQFLGKDKMDAGRLLKDISGSSSASTESMDRLNSTMGAIEALLRQNQKQNNDMISAIGKLRGVVY